MSDFCITIDLDRDVNVSVPGQVFAGSLDRGDGVEPRFHSTQRGLEEYLNLLDDLSVPATFFAEAETLDRLKDIAGTLGSHEVGSHGFEHEDFSLIDPDEAELRIIRSLDIIKDRTGVCPRTFRAPYMKKPEYLEGLLLRLGFNSDSSGYSDETGFGILPSGLFEVPVSVSECSGCRRTAYLWPMHEGKRTFESYIMHPEDLTGPGPYVLADHSWHIFESRKDGIRDEEGVQTAINNVRNLLEALLDAGFRPKTVKQVVDGHSL